MPLDSNVLLEADANVKRGAWYFVAIGTAQALMFGLSGYEPSLAWQGLVYALLALLLRISRSRLIAGALLAVPILTLTALLLGASVAVDLRSFPAILFPFVSLAGGLYAVSGAFAYHRALSAAQVRRLSGV